MTWKLKVLVAGATGQQGGAVAHSLIRNGHYVRALTRHADSPAAMALAEVGAELCEGDLDNTDSLVTAMENVDALFGVTTPYEMGPEKETQQGKNLVDAARKAGVQHFVFSSVGSADKHTGIPHFDSKYRIEEYLRGSGIPYTIIAPVFFMENWLSQWFLPSIKDGNVALAMPENCTLQEVSTADIGNFATLVFERRNDFLGQRIDIASDSLSGKQVAKQISQKIGSLLGFYEIPIDSMREQNEDFAVMFEWFKNVGYSANLTVLKRDYPEMHWTSFGEWVDGQDWSILKR